MLAVLLTASAATVASSDASGRSETVLGPFAKTIEGTVYDHLDNVVGGVYVVVEIWVGYWPTNYGVLSGSQATLSDSWGYYEVTFDANEWSTHYVIEVNGTKGSTQWLENAEANGDTIQTVDLDSSFEIPELDSPATLAFVALVTVAFVLFAARLTRARLR
ncbi:MAG: hypothetical protein MUC90_06655 [Thermoplasmata archaeon]|nr:hypothetical protein [Thermoplasmata archaeon]